MLGVDTGACDRTGCDKDTLHWVGGKVCSVTGTGDIEFHAITRYHPTYQHRMK